MGPQNNETNSALNKGFSGGLFIAMLSLYFHFHLIVTIIVFVWNILVVIHIFDNILTNTVFTFMAMSQNLVPQVSLGTLK